MGPANMCITPLFPTLTLALYGVEDACGLYPIVLTVEYNVATGSIRVIIRWRNLGHFEAYLQSPAG
jgi:hypothetical protein